MTAINPSPYAGILYCTSITRPANPVKGAHIYEIDTGNDLVYQGETTDWTPPWNTAWGFLAVSKMTAAVALPSTGVAQALPGLTMNDVIVKANRRMRIGSYANFGKAVNVATSRAGMHIYQDTISVFAATNLTPTFNAASSSYFCFYELMLNPATAGIHDYTFDAWSDNNAASSFDHNYSYSFVEDLGPSGPPL